MKLVLVGRDRVVEQHPDQTVLDACEAAGIRVRSGCRYGACRTCAARLVEGRISMPPGTALTERQLQDRYFLPCVARARTDCVIEVSGSSPLLPTRPWTD